MQKRIRTDLLFDEKPIPKERELKNPTTLRIDKNTHILCEKSKVNTKEKREKRINKFKQDVEQFNNQHR